MGMGGGEMSLPTITSGELEELPRRARPIEMIDVRTPVESRGVHAEPARLVPPHRLDPRAIVEVRRGGKAVAGALDSCLMGMLPARMPWDRVEPDEVACPQ